MTVPRDREGSVGPEIVKKRRKRLSGVGEMVVPRAAKGLTTGEVQAHLSGVCGAEVSRQAISTVTGKVLEGVAEWQNRPLDPVCPVVFIDAIHVEIRNGAAANRPVHAALAVTAGGRRDIPGLRAGDGRRGRQALDAHPHRDQEPRSERRPHAGLRRAQGPAEAVGAVWPRTTVQTCVVHLLRNSFRHAARQDRDKIAKVRKPVCTAAAQDAALERFAEFADAWGRKYPAIVRLWQNAREECTPFLRFGTEIRRIVCTTNAIESVNARIRRAAKAPGHFPNKQTALKCRRRRGGRLHGDHAAGPDRQGPGPLDHALEDSP